MLLGLISLQPLEMQAPQIRVLECLRAEVHWQVVAEPQDGSALFVVSSSSMRVCWPSLAALAIASTCPETRSRDVDEWLESTASVEVPCLPNNVWAKDDACNRLRRTFLMSLKGSRLGECSALDGACYLQIPKTASTTLKASSCARAARPAAGHAL